MNEALDAFDNCPDLEAAPPEPEEKLFDIIVYEIESRKVAKVHSNVPESGHINVDKRLASVLSRLNDAFDADAVPAGKYKVGDTLPEKI